MSNLITEAFVEQYRDNIIMLSQQRGSVIRPAILEESFTGRSHYFDRLGKTVAAERTTRHGDTPITPSQHSRRVVHPKDFQWADYIDDTDRLRMLIDPQDAYVRAAAWAIGRSVDDRIIAAFNGDAETGQSGGTFVSFPAGQVIDNGGTPTKFTLTYLRQAARLLDENDVMGDDRHIVVAPKAIEDLLEDSTVTSSDFNTVKALVNGEINTFMGFTFHKSTRLPLATGNIRSCFAWQRLAMGLAVNQDLMVTIDRLPQKQNSVQVYVKSTFNAIRIEEEAVVEIKYDEDL